jgi:glycosyltransferase involved in cell wall biosynthesis
MMNVALVHDYLIQDGGAERVLLVLHELFPQAPIFTLFHDPAPSHPRFRGADIRPSFLQKLPGTPKHYQWYLPLMPHAIESFDLSGFDLVLSSTSSFAKGVIAAPGALHVSYCHTPTRFLWEERTRYVGQLAQPSPIKRLLPFFLHRMRQWDALAAQRPDLLLTNSRTSQARIRRYYRREATVLHPPVDLDGIEVSPLAGSYWLAGGRLVPYKRFDLLVATFNALGEPIKIFGDGPELPRLRRDAKPNVELLGRIDETAKRALYRHAKGFLYPQVEDFGFTAVEAMGAGKPVIAFGQGGATETIVDGATGVFFYDQTTDAIRDALRRAEAIAFDPQAIRARAETFAKAPFIDAIRQVLAKELGTPIV